MAGAAWGALLSYSLFSQMVPGLFGVAFAFTSFFTLIGVAGVLLLRNHRLGVPLSLVVQGMQVPVLLSSGASYYANAGLGLRLTADSAWNLGFYFHLGTELHYSWLSDRSETTVGINLVAVILLYLLVTRVEEPPPLVTSPESRGAA